MGFRLIGLPLSSFEHLFGRTEDELLQTGILRIAAKAGSPCRITLADAELGELVLLLSFEHASFPTPYRSTGPIFVREAATGTAAFDNFIPHEMQTRLYSVRAYDQQGTMIEADIAEGVRLEDVTRRLFGNEQVAFLHLHHARRGCYACRVDRA